MADLAPLRPLRFDTAVAGPLDRLIAPPYDVIDAAERDRLRSMSAYNAVHLELPDPPYERVGQTIAEWVAAGALARAGRPGLMAWTQTFTLQDGRTSTRRVILGAVRAEPYSSRQVRPHERTHAGPKEDRLRLLYGARHQISPVYGLYPDAAGEVWASLAPTGAPQAQFTGSDGTRNSLWWVDDQQVVADAGHLMADRWILIADGHHRYETAVRFSDEMRAGGAGAGAHEFVMMGLTAIEDPGLLVLPTHRVLAIDPGDLSDRFQMRSVGDAQALATALAATPLHAPAFGLVTAAGAFVLTCPPVDDPSPAARLDVAVLERMVFLPSFGRDQAQLAHDGALTYVKDADEAFALGSTGRAAAVFILRDMPKDAVVQVAEAGETMPQKSTFFFPKLPTGVAFHPFSEG